MNRQTIHAWLVAVDGLSPEPREAAARALAARVSLASVLQLLEARLDDERHWPHCSV